MYDVNTRTTPGPSDRELAETYGDFLRNPSKPRPSATEGIYRFSTPEQLRAAQAQWDNARAKEREIAKWTADRTAEREAKAEAQRVAWERQQTERQQAERAKLESRLKHEFLGTNPAASEADWERLKGQLIDRALLEGQRPIRGLVTEF